MIVRVWEAHAVPSKADAFCATVQSEALPALRDTAGCLGVEMLRSVTDGDHRILVISRWQDEAALRAYAGPMWKIRPIFAEGELSYMEHPPRVAHYIQVTQSVTAA